ncbi:MAG: hypothetical protein ACPKPY_09350, partial [Nitrososphaeraceae archaeon]
PNRPNIIYYKLTDAGLFYLLAKMKDYHLNDYEKFLQNKLPVTNFLQNYSENILFKLYIYPIMEYDSFKNVKGIIICYNIFIYLMKISSLIFKYLEIFYRNKTHLGQEISHLYWSCFLEYDPNDNTNPNNQFVKKFFDYLSGNISLGWLHDNKRYKKIDEQTIKFSALYKKLVLKLDEVNKKIILKYNDEEIGYYKIRKEYNDYLVYSNIVPYQDLNYLQYRYELPDFSSELSALVEELFLSILSDSYYFQELHQIPEILNDFMSIVEKDDFLINKNKNMEITFKDTKTLSSDSKFKNILTRIHKKHNDMFIHFSELKNNNNN